MVTISPDNNIQQYQTEQSQTQQFTPPNNTPPTPPAQVDPGSTVEPTTLPVEIQAQLQAYQMTLDDYSNEIKDLKSQLLEAKTENARLALSAKNGKGEVRDMEDILYDMFNKKARN